MKRIEARDATGRVMACWPMGELDRAQRLVSLSESPWTIGVSEFESEAEADAKRLNWMDENILAFEFARAGQPIREAIDTARNAPQPTWTPI